MIAALLCVLSAEKIWYLLIKSAAQEGRLRIISRYWLNLDDVFSFLPSFHHPANDG